MLIGYLDFELFLVTEIHCGIGNALIFVKFLFVFIKSKNKV